MTGAGESSSDEHLPPPRQLRTTADVDVPAASDSAAAPKLGRFEVLGSLGAGGMGQVFEARDRELDRKVAVKVLHQHGPATEKAQARLLREAQALAKISHPNVVSVYDVGRDELGEVYIAMEFVRGGTLAAWLRDTTPAWTEVLRLFIDLAEGLQAMHDLGIVHRDFKPGNVLIDGRGRPVLIDFGLARPEGETSPVGALSPDSLLNNRLTRTGALVGTPSYMSPEQFKGKAVDGASDQFAFCISLYEALYGSAPFDGDNIPTRAASVLGGEIHEPEPGDVPRELLEVLRRGLRLEPENRWESMHEVASLLREFLRSHDPRLDDPAETRRRRIAIVVNLGVLVTFPGTYYVAISMGWIRFTATTLALSDAINAGSYIVVTRLLRGLWGRRRGGSQLGRGLERFAMTVAVLFLAQSTTGLIAGRAPTDTVLANLVGFSVLAFVLAPFVHQVTRSSGLMAACFTVVALILPEHALLCLDLTAVCSAVALAVSVPRRRNLRWISAAASEMGSSSSHHLEGSTTEPPGRS